jgi:hypothetical protein
MDKPSFNPMLNNVDLGGFHYAVYANALKSSER